MNGYIDAPFTIGLSKTDRYISYKGLPEAIWDKYKGNMFKVPGIAS